MLEEGCWKHERTELRCTPLWSLTIKLLFTISLFRIFWAALKRGSVTQHYISLANRHTNNIAPPPPALSNSLLQTFVTWLLTSVPSTQELILALVAQTCLNKSNKAARRSIHVGQVIVLFDTWDSVVNAPPAFQRFYILGDFFNHSNSAEHMFL